MTLDQRCWNHDAREAVSRCPQCGRSFCRECVSEHEGRLLCNSCLRTISRSGAAGRPRRLRTLGLLAGGLLLAWLTFFAAAESLVILSERSERISWQAK